MLKDKLQCIIVDDEPLAVEILEEYISKIPWIACKAVFDSGMAALDYLSKEHADLIFLDIQMPDLSGIQVAKLLKADIHVIFTTAYHEFAVEGFELEVTDYLLKPISFERLLKAVERVKPARLEADNNESSDYLFVKAEYKIIKIRHSEILYIEGMKDYLRIVTDTQKVMTLQSFSKLLPSLPEKRFMRIHKSYVISLDAIESIEKGKVKIGEQFIPIGESYKESLDALIKQRLA